MAISNFVSPLQNTTDADFRAWTSAIHNGLISIGIVNVVDSGEINLTTALKPSTTSEKVGYKIYRLDDTLQSTVPIFIKIYFGSSSANVVRPAIWISCGKSWVDGGTLNDIIFTEVFNIMASSTASFLDGYVCGQNNRFLIHLGCLGSVTTQLLFGLERTHNNVGSDTSLGLMLVWGNLSGSSTVRFKLARYDGQTTMEGYSGGYIQASVPQVGTGILAPNTYAYPVRIYGPAESAPYINICSYSSGDFNLTATYSLVCPDGVERTYLTASTVSYPLQVNPKVAVAMFLKS